MLDAGCRMLDARCSMLDAGCSMLDAGCSMLDAGCSILDARCWMLDAEFFLIGNRVSPPRKRFLTEKEQAPKGAGQDRVSCPEGMDSQNRSKQKSTPFGGYTGILNSCCDCSSQLFEVVTHTTTPDLLSRSAGIRKSVPSPAFRGRLLKKEGNFTCTRANLAKIYAFAASYLCNSFGVFEK
jgi:hypothetical protein